MRLKENTNIISYFPKSVNRVFSKILNYIKRGYNINMEYQYCKRCGKKLKGDKFKQIGYGPVCILKIKSHKTPLFKTTYKQK